MVLYDLRGAEIISKTTFSNQLEIDISHLEDGIYLAVIERGESSIVEKIVKNNR